MEILLALVVLAVIAAAAFLYMRSRNGAAGPPERGPALRGRRGTRGAARQDPMAQAVENHAMATDPHEAAEAELRLQAQANRVASDLHAQQASALESQAGRTGGIGGRGGAGPADPYGQPTADPYGQPTADPYGQPAYDEAGRPVYEDRRRVDQDGQPVYEDGSPVYQDRQPLPEEQGGPAYHDEHGRPVYPEDRPRY